MEKHTTVLLTEAVDALAIKPSSTYVDATLGAHGHAERIVACLMKEGTFVGIDADQSAIEGAQAHLHGECRILLQKGNFKDVDSILERAGIAHVDGILADLGWRMEQFSGNGKGFSFQIEEPLLMTFGDPSTYPFTAYDIVNDWDEDNIVSILEGYGEERYAKRIARGILRERVNGPLRTTFDLTRVIEASVPSAYRHGRINPSTRTFQALRIAVNDELGALDTFIRKSIDCLRGGGRLAIISFHSLEDRIVKHLFREYKERGEVLLITKKPIVPTLVEKERNTRSRSAKLRIVEKI